jgi:DNA-binding transcriptional MerR regulator
MFRIGEFAALTRVSQRMLRHYDEIGLLRPDTVDPRTGYRSYSAAQLRRLNRIIALKELGFGLDDVGRLLDERVSVEQMRTMLQRRRDEVTQRVREDQERLAQIARRLEAIERDELHPLGDVVVRKVPDTLMATLRMTVPSLGKPVEHLFDETELHVSRHDARSPASPLMLFHTAPTRKGLEVEVAVPVKRPIPETPRISVREVEGADHMACLVYSGGYHQTEHAIRTLHDWTTAIGGSASGRAREVYLRFGAEDAEALGLPERFLATREADYVTEIQLPITASTGEK